MLYRGKNGRTTDGEKVWQNPKEEYVGSPPGYVPPTHTKTSAAVSLLLPGVLLAAGTVFFIMLMIIISLL